MLSAVWQPGWKGSLVDNDTCIVWFASRDLGHVGLGPFAFHLNYYNIVNQLYPYHKIKVQKIINKTHCHAVQLLNHV